ATSRRASSSRETSACTYTASGSERASISPISTERDELTTTLAPSLANCSATALPIPLDDPVTTTTSLTQADPTDRPTRQLDAEPRAPHSAQRALGRDRRRTAEAAHDRRVRGNARSGDCIRPIAVFFRLPKRVRLMHDPPGGSAASTSGSR